MINFKRVACTAGSPFLWYSYPGKGSCILVCGMKNKPGRNAFPGTAVSVEKKTGTETFCIM
ncbi:hypothetical protein EAJ17_08335 [Akkermansia sp. aa_0143]|nr:hypothetical protein [Akkermansia sp.]RYT97213.1 hypothetical protein EAJ17_08335 [Akkermansia sp. aa_0143]